MFRTTLGLGFGIRPGVGHKLLGPRMCYRGPGGGGIGITPTQLEMSQAKEFQVQLTTYREGSWVCGERNVFDDVRCLRDCRQVSYAGSMHALFLLDKDLFCAVMANAVGHHHEKIEMMAKYPKDLRLQMLDCLVWEQTPRLEQAHFETASACAVSILAFSYWAGQVSRNQEEIRNTLFDLLEFTPKKAQLINQVILALNETGYALGEAKADFALAELDVIVGNLLANPDPSIYPQLIPPVIDFLSQKYGAEFVELLKNAKPAKEMGTWKPEWGPKPSQEEIEEAKRFMQGRGAGEKATIETLLKTQIRVSTLYFIDPEYAVNIVGYAEGNHQNVGNRVSAENEAFIFEFLDMLIDREPGFMESFASIIYMVGLEQDIPGGEVLAKYFRQTKKKKQLLLQTAYASGVNKGNKLRQSIGPWMFFVTKEIEAQGVRLSLWQELDEDTQGFLIRLSREEGIPELLERLGKGTEKKAEVDLKPFFAELAKAETENYLATNYSPKGVELFLNIFPEPERVAALTAILKNDEAVGRMLMRSAKGHHVEIAAALAKVPEQVLLPVLQREILEFPVLDPNNRQALSDFYTHNGFGAMKYLIYNGDPTQIKMSPLFSLLSNEAIAKLLQIFHVFCTMESMLGRMLAAPLRTALNNLGLARIAEISSGISKETADWLMNSGVIDLGQMLAVAGGVDLGPNETGFHGKVYSPAAWEEFKKSGKRLKEVSSWQRGIILRSAKFHTETRNLLESFSNQEIARILDEELSNFSNFDNDYETRQFMELDGCSLMKIVALLAIERSVAIFNLISLETAASIFEQARYFSQTSEYFFNEFILRIKSADLDRNRIVQVLPLLKEPTSVWVKLKVFNRELNELEFEVRMKKALENDADLLAIGQVKDLDSAKRLAARLLGAFLNQFPTMNTLSMVDDLNLFTYEYLGARQLLLIRAQKEAADSRELFLLAELAKRIIEIRAPQILASGVDLRGIQDGAVVAKVAIIDSPDWQQNRPALYHLSPFNLVVIDEHPANDAQMSKVAAMVTSRNKGDHDHATLRAKDWGIPLASLPAASKFLKALNGKWVVFEVKGSQASIKLASTEQIKTAQAQYGLIPVEEAVKDKADVLVTPAEVRENVGRVGTKAFNLAELAGYATVPPFYVLTSGASHRYFRAIGLYEAAQAILGSYQTDDPQVLYNKLAKIRKLVIQGDLPKHYLQGINAQNIIARASTNLEDLQAFTAAGVYGSYVGASFELEMIIKKAMASYWGDRAFAYREKYGVDHFEQLPAVIVQAFIPGDFSGNLIVDKDQAIVNVVPGLGEGHASGRVPADEYHYSFDQRVFTETIKRPKGEAARISGYEPLTGQEQLADDLIIKLALIGQMIFGKKGKRQDVEWTVKDGEIFIVQTRPV